MSFPVKKKWLFLFYSKLIFRKWFKSFTTLKPLLKSFDLLKDKLLQKKDNSFNTPDCSLMTLFTEIPLIGFS